MKRALLALFLTTIALPAAAWTKASEQRIAMKAAQLAPADLRQLLVQFESDYKTGLAEARAEEEAEGHRGRLRERIDRETAATIKMIREGDPMREVVARMGVLAHLVGDANNPFHSSNDPQLATLQKDYELYFERRMPKFPTVFYGLAPNFRPLPYFERTFARAARFHPLLREEYFRYGQRRTASEFDDRSTAFGIASVSYSRTVSDLVNLLYYIWREAGGDVRSSTVMRSSTLLLNAN